MKKVFEKGFYMGRPKKTINKPAKTSYMEKIKKSVWCFDRESTHCKTQLKSPSE